MILGVIPARFQSVRFPGKVIAPLAGKPIIAHIYERIKKSKLLDKIIIAIDDPQVAVVCDQFAIPHEMTSRDHQSGTDRIIEINQHVNADIVVNIQGDEPFIKASDIDLCISMLLKHQDIDISSLAMSMDHQVEIHDPNRVKVVFDERQRALYFSRSPIPYNRDNRDGVLYYQHIGIYGFRNSAMQRIQSLPLSRLEMIERLEQLRWLEAGLSIQIGLIEPRPHIGIDTPEDLCIAENLINQGLIHLD